MGKILDFFKRSDNVLDPPVDFGSLLNRVQPYSKTALKLRRSPHSTNAYFGGSPKLPNNVDWPTKNGEPLAFLASIDLAQVASTGVIPWLPDEGHLLFFFDTDEQPWGFDPKDRGSWAVIHVLGPAEEHVVERRMEKRYFDLEPFDSLPNWERFESLGLSFSDQETDVYIDRIFDLDDDEDEHQMSGYPQNIQGDGMELECQLASNGVYVGDPTSYNSPEADLLKAGESDWRLLLQHSGDEESGLMWGDCGRIYFWVKEQEAKRGDFSNCWLVLQCS